jgi:hypothetical protein
LINSTIWVHKADLHQTGSLAQSDYVLFKLRQLMAVDVDILNRLLDRFRELNVKRNGFLSIGDEIPSAAMVKDIQDEVAQAPSRLMMDIWNERRFDLITKHKPERQNFYVPKSVKPIRLNECHDFLWSNTLWSEKAHKAWILVLKMTVSYLVLGYLTVAYLDPSIADGSIVSLNGWYFMSATMFTVGLGDFAPELMLTRAFAIIQIPFGLFIVSFALAGLTMVRNAKPKPLKKDSLSSRVTDARRLFKMIDTANTGVIERSDVLKKARECFDMSQEEAGALFDSLDLDLSGTLEMHEIELQEQPSRWDSIPVRLLIMLAKLYFTISICAIFFKQHSSYGSTEDFTWVDCFYFATVIATSIGGSICCCLSACSNKLLRYFLPGRLWRHHTLNEYGKDFSHFLFYVFNHRGWEPSERPDQFVRE